jgi:hypothetical protein
MSILSYFNDILILSAAVIGIIRYKMLSRPFKVLTISMIASLIIVVLSSIFVIKYKTNVPILHLEAIAQFIFYAVIYYYLFTDQRIINAVTIFIIFFSVFSIINALFLQPFHKVFPTYINLPTLGLLAVFSLLLFKQMLLFPLKTPILKQGVFWFNTAILFYSTTMFLAIGLSNIYSRYRYFDLLLTYFWYGILHIFAVLIGVALLTDNKEINKTYAI